MVCGLVPVILISAGVGITPMISMLKAHEKRTDLPLPSLYFIHSAKTLEEQAFKEEVEPIIERNKHFHSYYILSQEPDTKQCNSNESLSKVQIEKIMDGIGSYFLDKWVPIAPDECEYYICGPLGFQDKALDILKDIGANMQKVYTENFHPKVGEYADAPEEATITYSLSDISAIWKKKDNNSLLELAEENHLELDHACRMGSCGTCRCKIKEGKVFYNIAPTAELAEDEVLLCCAKPATSKIVLNI